jgi:hypothetical protein
MPVAGAATAPATASASSAARLDTAKRCLRATLVVRASAVPRTTCAATTAKISRLLAGASEFARSPRIASTQSSDPRATAIATLEATALCCAATIAAATQIARQEPACRRWAAAGSFAAQSDAATDYRARAMVQLAWSARAPRFHATARQSCVAGRTVFSPARTARSAVPRVRAAIRFPVWASNATRLRAA